ncbi:hypothetical protein PSTA9_02392 [Pseudomonas syringae pv. tomato]|nr:hypothetical protein PSTA9_02392 [Pseudomonas syringae pv. tomato]
MSRKYQTDAFQLGLQAIDGLGHHQPRTWQPQLTGMDFCPRLSLNTSAFHKHLGRVGTVQGIPQSTVNPLEPAKARRRQAQIAAIQCHQRGAHRSMAL